MEPITPEPTKPVRQPVMYQGWYNLASVHWRYNPEDVQPLLPDGYLVDHFDGSAWVGLIPFQMTRIRFRGLPPFGPLSTFPETNVRTYIVGPDGRRAVWFASLDITRLLPTAVARIFYRLPYCWAGMDIANTGNDVTYEGRRRWPLRTRGAYSRMTIRIGAPIDAEDVTPLEQFLTARWALGTSLGKRLVWAQVEHGRWPLHRAELLECDENLITATGLPSPSGTPYVLYSPGVDVRIGPPKPLPRLATGTAVRPTAA